MAQRRLDRRTFLGAAALAATALPGPAIAQRARAATLRLVPDGDLAVLDPLQSTSQPTQVHCYFIYDTLFAQDASGRPRPQMADGIEPSADGRVWTIRLRDGLLFHDGEPVLARDCVASLQRWSARDGMGQMLARAVAEWAAPDDKTIRITLGRPFPRILDALSKPSWAVPFIMPARVAATPPTARITDFTGCGPYRFKADEQLAGSRVVYEKFDRYRPRPEPAERTAGGKVAHFDRVEWVVMPDATSAAAALATGEVDWWEKADNNLLPVLRRNSNLTVQVTDPGGQLAVMRFNLLQSPFNDPAVRRALLLAVDQRDYLTAAVGDDPESSRTCRSLFPCTGPLGNEAYGQALAGPRDLERARAAIRAAGHEGEKVVVLNATDSGLVRGFGAITTELLKRLGLDAELREMDFNAMIQVRGNTGPVSSGGWSVFHTWWGSSTIANPVTNLLVRGLGADGYAGWYRSERAEALVTQWLDAATPEAERAAVDALLQDSMEQLPTLPLGMTFASTAFRRELTGVLGGIAPFPWNVRRAAA
jgi:peptide/nickel transport system substrate-binding protein